MSQEHIKLRYNRIPFHVDAGEKILQLVEAHWERMRDNETVPSQASVSPEALDDVLAHCFVLERVAPTIARFRVAGKQMNALLGVDVRGMPLSTLFSEDGREALAEVIKSVCDRPEIVEVPLTATRGLRRSVLRGRLLLLPLKDRDGGVTRIFGAIVLDGAVKRHIVRFDFDRTIPIRCKRLTPLIRTISEMKAAVADLNRDYEKADLEQPSKAPSKSGARSYLQLVVDNT